MDPLYSELRWLPRMAEGFSERLKDLGNQPGPLGREFQSLASHALDLNQLTKLAKAIGKARADGKSLDPLVPFKLAILTNSTFDLIVPALVASAARHGIALEVIQPSYDQAAQEALTPDSKVNSSKPDAVLFALDYRALPLKLSLGNREASSATIQGVIGYLQTLRNGIKANSNAVCIFQTFAPPVETLFGSLDRALQGTMRNLIDGINRELVGICHWFGRCAARCGRFGGDGWACGVAQHAALEYGQVFLLRRTDSPLRRSRCPYRCCHSRQERKGPDPRSRQHCLGRSDRGRWLGGHQDCAGRRARRGAPGRAASGAGPAPTRNCAGCLVEKHRRSGARTF